MKGDRESREDNRNIYKKINIFHKLSFLLNPKHKDILRYPSFNLTVGTLSLTSAVSKFVKSTK